jgi:hypothetical protein
MELHSRRSLEAYRLAGQADVQVLFQAAVSFRLVAVRQAVFRAALLVACLLFSKGIPQ